MMSLLWQQWVMTQWWRNDVIVAEAVDDVMVA